MRNYLLVATITCATALSSACSADPATQPNGLPDVGMGTELGHIHGMAVDPADGALFVATHTGLFRSTEGGTATRVANRYQDTMAFTVTGPGEFLASGHPDLREDLPSHLGLIQSTDAGRTWQPLALQGEADFHILEPAAGVLYAYDATSQRLLRSTDRRDFEEVLTSPLVSVAAVADRALFATTDTGQVVAIDPETRRTRNLDAPATLFLDTTLAPELSLVGIGPTGTVRISVDGTADSWREIGSIEAPPVAFTITDQGWYAATESGVLLSEDDGRTWELVLRDG